MVVANHPLYIDAGTNSGFEAVTGIRVEYHEEVTDDGAWLASVTPQLERGESLDLDVVVVSDWAADRLARRGWLVPGTAPTWALGMTGVAYDAHAVDAVGGEIVRLAQLFQPPLHGRVALPTDLRTALGTALLADHVDPSTVTLEQATATAARLANSVKVAQVLPFDHSNPIDHLVAGECAAAVVRASDTVGLERDRPDIRFVVPEEGGLLLTDVVVMPLTGANPDAARRYVEYVNDPVHAAERFRALPVVWPRGPVDAQLAARAPEVVADPRRNPPDDIRARLRTFRFLDDGDDRAFAALFDGVIHATR